MVQKNKFHKYTLLLIGFSTFLRLIISGSLELGNDEVYYWLYALHPDISHFDHPPMVGFFIQLFTANLFFDSELFIRLASVITASISMYIVYKIATVLKNEKTGFIATILYNLNFYGLIISGTFILPDTPLVVFWLSGFYFFLKSIPYEPNRVNKRYVLLGFLCVAFAVYSKYQAVYLPLGVGLYILIFNKKWLKNKWLYIGAFLPLISIFLIYYWNFKNDFISYQFHQNRVSFFSISFNEVSFFREILGQFLYNNPYIFIITFLFIFSFFKGTFAYNKRIVYFFLLVSMPLIITTIYLSISRDTLPHWSGISYLTLLPLVAVFISNRKNIIKSLLRGFSAITLILLLGLGIINKGWLLPSDTSSEKTSVGKNDFTLDLYGWRQASEKTASFLKEKELTHYSIVSNKWFPASHIHYYMAEPLQMPFYAKGSLKDIHKYYWINKKQSPLPKQTLYITDSRNYKNPSEIYSKELKKSELLTEIPIKRGNKVVKYIFIYELLF